MNSFWSNVCAGTIGAVLSAAAIAAIGELGPLGLHLIIPDDAVIPMSGECPSGWREYDAASGQYIVAPMGNVLEDYSQAPNFDAATPGSTKGARGATSRHPGPRLVLPNQSTFIILNLCQRR